MSIDVRASFDADVSEVLLFEVIRDLGTYPKWLEFVYFAEEVENEGGMQAWSVELRAKIGPFARSKRLRMVRTQDQGPRVVVFERRELDGKTHAPWVLKSEITGTSKSSTLKVHLHYGGSLFDGGIVERVLSDQIENGKARLSQYLDDE